MKDFLLPALNWLGLAYWVEIETTLPRCTYYFGPFLSPAEAEMAELGYLEDLKGEGAQGIQVRIKRCKPGKLTIFDETTEDSLFFKRMIPASS